MTFRRGTLREKIAQASAAALACGALQPIPTDTQFVAEGGVQFLVRVVSNLARKDQVQRAAGTPAAAGENPFLPYDPAMYVADASATHVCLLNRFNVVDHHLLIVTRQFEPQARPLNRADFLALWTCLVEYDSLGFYNAGEAAGASQPHKHLQLVPLPLADQGPRVPIEPLLPTAPSTPASIGQTVGFPFAHAFARFDPQEVATPAEAAHRTLALYRQMLHTLRLCETPRDPSSLTAPYNLLLTQQWLLVVPRSRERVAGISLNALAFAGGLLVRSPEQLQTLRNHGLLAALTQVAVAAGC
jgi:sulfate adenylyltransferase (ADP) / ATP adenylyltransferase